MSGFTIIYLFTLFCIPFAAAVVGRKLRCQIKEARFDDPYHRYYRTFDKGDVYLYEINDSETTFGRSYEVEDNSGGSSPQFDMGPYNTIVTDDRITVKFLYTTISIFTLDGNNVAFYQDLLSLEDFHHEFPVTRVVQGGETLEDVFAVNAKENEFGVWIFAAVDGSGPRLIFPLNLVKWTHRYGDIDKAVSFVLELGPNVKEITLEFEYSGVARTFYAFVDYRHVFATSSDETD